MSGMSQFGSPGAQFDYISSSSFWCNPNDTENGASSGETSQSVHSTDQDPFADIDQMLSWSGSAIPGDHLFFPCDSTQPRNNTSTGAGVLRVGNSQDSHFDINQDVLLLGGGQTERFGHEHGGCQCLRDGAKHRSQPGESQPF